MSDCPSGEKLHAFADGELDPIDAAEISEHLSECAICRDELDQIGKITGALRETEPVSSEEELEFIAENRILRAKKPVVPLLKQPAGPRSMAMAALFVFGLGTYIAVDLSRVMIKSFRGEPLEEVSEESMGRNQAALSAGIY